MSDQPPVVPDDVAANIDGVAWVRADHPEARGGFLRRALIGLTRQHGVLLEDLSPRVVGVKPRAGTRQLRIKLGDLPTGTAAVAPGSLLMLVDPSTGDLILEVPA